MPKNENYAELRRQSRERSFGCLYAFFGSESYLREHYLREMKRILLPEGTESFNWESLEGKGLSLPELKGAVVQIPLMGERRLVSVCDFDFGKISESDWKDWAAFLAELPASCCLVFTFDTVPFKRDRKNTALTALEQYGLCVEFETPEEAGLIAWITRHAASLGKNIAPESCRHLIFLCGASLMLMKNEIEKLAAYTQGQTIGRQELDLLVVPIPDAVAFTLGESLVAGRVREAAETLVDLKTMREPPERLLGAVAKTLRGVYAARLAREGRKSVADVQKMMGYRSAYPAEKLMKAAAKRDMAWCRRAMRACIRADWMLKRGAYSDRERVMEWLLATLA